MNGKHQFEGTQEWGLAADKSGRPARKQRLKHVAWAAGISLVLFLISALNPIDQLFWTVQSKLNETPPSGEFVFVEADSELADPRSENERIMFAAKLRELDRQGVDKIYVDIPFRKTSKAEADEALAQAIRGLGERVVLVGHLETELDGTPYLDRTIPSITGSTRHVVRGDHSDLFGISWSIPYFETVDGEKYQTLSAALSSEWIEQGQQIIVAYDAPLRDIPTVKLADITGAAQLNGAIPALAGRTIVIGFGRGSHGTLARIPGHRNVPPSLIPIYAAETAQKGQTSMIPGWLLLAFGLAVLAGVASITNARTMRRSGYVLLVLGIAGFIVISIISGLRAAPSYAAFAVCLYGAQRLRLLWQDWASLKDQDTGLPTLRAFERNLVKDQADGYVVVAKIHDFGRVLKLLPGSLQSTYVLKIADRLRASEPDLDLHFANHYFAWLSQPRDFAGLEEHLEGLRALFAAPLHIAGNQIDVGITFGVAQTTGQNLRSLPAAIAAAEETSEALCPIKLAEHADTRDGLWDISMRARIDSAMESGEVYCVYQPKVSVETGKAKGVEALVRWEDPERGSISPMHFIKECEKAGRMEHLTRYVLQSACTAGRLLHANGHRISMSVNISATLCSDQGIVEMVRNALQATKFPAHLLVLEVTETARIRDLSKAAAIIKQLKQLGVRISMDDFGVGEANFETFYELPFDELKIDRLFIKNITVDPKARAIATSLIAMGNEARITVVAEGVEHLEDLTILREIGCSEVQGFALSRPISLSNLLIYLSEGSNEGLTNVV